MTLTYSPRRPEVIAMDYEAVRPWAMYTYEVQDCRYDVFEGVLEPEEYVEYIRGAAHEPTLNLQADESTLNCLKWLLVDQKDVDLEVSSPDTFPDHPLS